MKTVTKLMLTLMMTFILLGSANVAFAQDDANVDRKGYGFRGEVTAKDDSSLTVETRNGEIVTVNVTDDTKIRLLGTDHEGTFEDIEAGNFVGARGQRNDNGSINARIIVVSNENPRDLKRVHGKVTGIEGSVITIEDRDGNSQDINTNDQTNFRKGKEKIGLEDIEIDDPVSAIGKDEDGAFVARLVLVATRAQIRKHTLVGEVLDVNLDEGTLTVQPNRDQEKAWLVKTTDDTKYRVPGKDDPALADIEVGNHVLIIGQRDEDAENSGTARAIAVIPKDRANAARARGQVASIDSEAESFTVDTDNGTFTILTDDSTHYRQRGEGQASFGDLEVGSKVLVFGQKTDQENTIQAKRVGIGASNNPNN